MDHATPAYLYAAQKLKPGVILNRAPREPSQSGSFIHADYNGLEFTFLLHIESDDFEVE